MRIRKGKYKVATPCSSTTEKQGSYGYSFPFMVHREEECKFWRVSHIATGFNITSNVRTVKQARAVVEKLKQYPIFLMPTIETWKKAKNRMKEQQPEQYNKMLDIVNLRDENNE